MDSSIRFFEHSSIIVLLIDKSTITGKSAKVVQSTGLNRPFFIGQFVGFTCVSEKKKQFDNHSFLMVEGVEVEIHNYARVDVGYKKSSL